ncbi:hypothetical protein ET445_13430 [Agromyces protaetiae]|uniref:Cell division protein FtsL n=1 Tax=Agromyces protaetiae TaxID=2509455 RepID=A0A4P6FGD7_9MICO|nr:hypothetical protein [Agromyces protaetiae]QAY74183.1 hypothetical protein ET445_13430 [Agromyces protaetiae]
MTALPAPSLPERLVPARRRRGAEAPERTLRPAPEPKRGRPRLAYAIIATAAVGVIFAVQMLLSIAMTEGAYEADKYELRQIKLSQESQKLREEIDAMESPQYLAQRAEALGMVPNNAPVYLRLSDGAVLGQPAAAKAIGGGDSALVPNALLDGVPPTGDAAAGETPGVEAQGAQAPPAGEAAPIVPATGLPTPTTH